MKPLFYICLSILLLNTKTNAQSFLSKADSLKRQYKFYIQNDSDTIYLTGFGSLEREFPVIIFKRFEFDRSDGYTIIEGYVDLCCFKVLIAKAIEEEKFINIRPFGQTSERSEALDCYRQTGWFSLKVKLDQDDALIIGIPGTMYWGATIIPVGKAQLE